MRKLQILVLAFGLIWCVPGDAAVGQLIRIFGNGGGGVDIRVPFVRVQTDGYGGSYVRAPFVAVDTPPRYYAPQPYYAQPAQPYYGQPPNFNYAQSYAPAQPGGTVINQPSQPASSNQPSPGSVPRAGQPSRGSTPVPAPRPESGTADKAIPAVADADSPPNPPKMKSVLADQGQADGAPGVREKLISDSLRLDQSLSTYTNAKLWQDYLKLPSFVSNEITWMEPGAISDDQMQQLVKTLQRFERTAEDPDLKLINQFDSFYRVKYDLTELLREIGGDSSRENEELPAPREETDR